MIVAFIAGCHSITPLQKPDIIIEKEQCGIDVPLFILFKVKVGRKCELWFNGKRISEADEHYKYENDRIAIELSILRNLKGLCKCTVSTVDTPKLSTAVEVFIESDSSKLACKLVMYACSSALILCSMVSLPY